MWAGGAGEHGGGVDAVVFVEAAGGGAAVGGEGVGVVHLVRVEGVELCVC